MRVDVISFQNCDQTAKGLFKIDLKDLPLPPDFNPDHQVMISIPPKGFGGNHKHRRREIFFSLCDDAELHWVDEEGIKRMHKMKEPDKLYLFDVHPLVPHAIINVSHRSTVVILELTEGFKHDIIDEPIPANIIL